MNRRLPGPIHSHPRRRLRVVAGRQPRSLRGQSPQRPGVIALTGATILTVTQGTIPNGTIVLRDGKIAAVGANVAVPAGAEVIDVTGQVRLAGHHRLPLAHRQRRRSTRAARPSAR